MAQVYVSLGSNIEPEKHLCSCLKHLRADFQQVVCSGVYQTPAAGFDGPPFLNAVVGFRTDLTIESLRGYLRQLENRHGRVRHNKKFDSRTLDADLLLYDHVVTQPEENLPHQDILKYPFVLYPLAEIAPHQRHPVLQQDLGQIARDSGMSAITLKAVQLDCERQTMHTPDLISATSLA